MLLLYASIHCFISASHCLQAVCRVAWKLHNSLCGMRRRGKAFVNVSLVKAYKPQTTKNVAKGRLTGVGMPGDDRKRRNFIMEMVKNWQVSAVTMFAWAYLFPIPVSYCNGSRASSSSISSCASLERETKLYCRKLSYWVP